MIERDPPAGTGLARLPPKPAAPPTTDGRGFDVLRIPAFRAWFLAQILSGSGGIAQGVAQAWLVLTVLHGGGVALGVLSAATFAPLLLAGAFAGAWLGQVRIRSALIATQVAAGAISGVLGVLVMMHVVRFWMVVALALATGCVNAVDVPARQLYVVTLVGRERVASAVGLYEVIVNASRIIGPSAGGLILALLGLAPCFFVNAASYVVPLAVLLRYRPDHQSMTDTPPQRTLTALRAGVRYIRRTPSVAACMLIAAAAGPIFNTPGTAVPLLATQTFGLGKIGLGLLIACFGIGAIPGGMAAAYSRNRRIGESVRTLCLLTSVAVFAAAASPARVAAFPLMMLVGFLSIWMIALANTLAQLRPDPRLRGPVMGIWSMILPGLVPVSALITGAVTQYAGPRVGYGIAGMALAAAAAVGWRALSDDAVN